MNYLLEINAFNRMMRRQPLSEAAQLLWFKLMDFDNHMFWQSPFQLDNDRLAELLGSSTNKAKTARDQLVQAGLLEFTQGVKRKPSAYRLIPPTTLEGPPSLSYLQLGKIFAWLDGGACSLYIAAQFLSAETYSTMGCG